MALIIPAGRSYPANGDNKVGGTGTIIPRDGLTRIDGMPGLMIDKIFVHDGQKVKRGAPLFQIQNVSAPYDQANAALDLEAHKRDAAYRRAGEALSLKAATARAQHATKDAANYKAIGPGGTSEREVSRLQQEAEQAQIALDAAKLHAQQLQFDLGIDLQNAQNRYDAEVIQLGRYVIRAPTDGTVIKIHHHVGEVVGGPDPVVEFGDLSAMYVDAQVYQGDIVKVRPGMKVTVKNSAFANLATGKVESVGKLVGTRSQLGDVLIHLDKNDPADRLVGMEVEIVIGP
ncbi:MAG TPA: efflux RND transporter periplasmic adaptor subunit [Stellaceae bacterium]|jgi:multidrug resistance efflux pump|nr:efflux RND transporter periplasmic adaptor subunit [Stellaceae bacterium]